VLKRKRLQRTIELPVRLGHALRLEYGDSVSITLPVVPYTRKTFMVEGWRFGLTGNSDGGGVPAPTIDLLLRENEPQAWN
jgi:hypothetical protein